MDDGPFTTRAYVPPETSGGSNALRAARVRDMAAALDGGGPGRTVAPLPPASPQEARDLPPLDVIAAADLGDADPPPRQSLVPGLIPSREITLFTGDGGTGKSLLTLQLAYARATGSDWIGFLLEPARVLFISAEDDMDELHRRLSTIARRKGDRLSAASDLDILSLAGRDAVLALPGPKGDVLVPTQLFQSLRARIEQTRPDLLVLDTLADLFGGDEIKRSHARQFIGLLRGLCIDFGVTIVLLSHPSKDGLRSDDGTSGSTAWSNSVRSRLYLKRPRVDDDDAGGQDTYVRVLATKKANYGRIGEERVLRWREGVFVPDFQSSLASVGAEASDEQIFLDCLDEFERTGQDCSPNKSATFAPALFAGSPTAKGVPKGRLAHAMSRLFARGAIHVIEVGPQSNRRKRIARGPAPVRGEEVSR